MYLIMKCINGIHYSKHTHIYMEERWGRFHERGRCGENDIKDWFSMEDDDDCRRYTNGPEAVWSKRHGGSPLQCPSRQRGNLITLGLKWKMQVQTKPTKPKHCVYIKMSGGEIPPMREKTQLYLLRYVANK